LSESFAVTSAIPIKKFFSDPDPHPATSSKRQTDEIASFQRTSNTSANYPPLRLN
jgi:hypothetical protein